MDLEKKKSAAGVFSTILRVVVPSAVFLLLATRGFFDESIGYPDADRILMDGVFIADFLKSMPLDHPFEFALTYFAQHPALSIGYRPPFFPFIESLSILGFGVHVWAGRIALIFLAIVGGTAFFRMLSKMYDSVTAAVAVTLLASLPFLAQWSWYTMAEVPVLAMLLLTALFFWRYAETGQGGYAYLAALSFALTLWTKQTAAFAVFWFVPFLFIRQPWKSILTSRTFWLSTLMFVVMVLPLAAMTIWMGDLNIGQSVGDNPRGQQLPRWHWDNLQFYLLQLLEKQLTWPIVAMALAGLATAVIRRDRHLPFFLLLVVSTYLFFTLLNDPHLPRYTLFWLPAFTAFAALPMHYLRGVAARGGYIALGALAVAYNIHVSLDKTPQHSTGYQEAARYVVEHNDTQAVFIDAWNNGYFTFFVRANDPQRKLFVVRGDKVFSSSAVDTTTWVTLHAKGAEDIRQILNQHAISHIVVEKDNYTDLQIHDIFREVLAGEDFALRKEIPIESSLSRYRDQSLLIYEYLSRKDTGEKGFTLHLPIVGKLLKIPADGGSPELIPIPKP